MDPDVSSPTSLHKCEDILDVIPQIISDKDNEVLMAPFSIEELQKLVFTFSPNKTLGPNRFTPLFYRRCWDVIC